MGQKIHPLGFRLRITQTHRSSWFANPSTYPALLEEDYKIRNYLRTNLATAGISKIEVHRKSDYLELEIHTSRPGIIVGRSGSGIEKIKEDLAKIVKFGNHIRINVTELKNVDADAKLIAENIAAQLEKRVAFRRAMKKVMQNAFRAGVKGIRVRTAGRLGGAEMARAEGYSERKVPLHTLRADIDYETAEAQTTYGKIGVKVWVYKGEIYK